MTDHWKDATSYQQGDTVREPRIWEQRSGSIVVSVHRYQGCEGWFVTCHALGIAARELGDIPLTSAKIHAIRIVNERVDRLAAEVACLH